jgi:hypothetical protein
MPRDHELTSRLVFDWPESKRKTFWAFGSLRDARERRGVLTGVDWDGTLDHPQLKVGRQEFNREGPVERVLWVYVSNKDGSLDFRPAKSP